MPASTYDNPNRFPGVYPLRAILCALAFFTAQFALAEVLATVGDTKITVEEFNRKFEEIKRQTPNPPTAEQYLEDLTRIEMGLREAEKLKLSEEPQVRERYKQILYTSLLEKELGKKVEGLKVTENEIKEYYKKNPELRLSHVLIELKPNSSPTEIENTRKRAQAVFDDIKKSKRPFEEMAKLYSEDTNTKESGGDIGWQSRLSLPTALFEAALAAKEGELKGPVQTRFGFHIIKLNEKRPYDLSDKRLIRAAVMETKREKLFTDYFESLKKKYKIEINRAALKGLGSQD